MWTRKRGWLRRVGLAVATLAVSWLAVAPAALAVVSQAYGTTGSIPLGSLVSLDAKVSGNVVIADLLNQSRLAGVVVSSSTAALSLAGADATGQVQVATSGAATVLVSTASGDVKVGDSIAASAIAGIGQKAIGHVRVIGTAQADLNAKTAGVTKRSVEDESGAKREVAIGQIPVLIAVASNNSDGDQTSGIPTWIQSIADSLAGRAVSPVRVIIAGLILLVGLVSVTVLLYSAVRNGIISIGRNPLSRTSVLKGLFQVAIIAVVILAVTIGAMYLVISQ
jgi:hypothetical protein